MRAWAFPASVVAYALVWAWAVVALPDPAPVHFGLDGRATTYSSKAGALAVFAAIGTGTAVVLAWASRMVERGSLTMLNVPHRQWWTRTPGRERRVRELARGDVEVVATATMVLLAVMVGTAVAAALDDDPRLGVLSLAAVILYVVGLVALALHGHRRRYRPDLQEGL